MPKQAFAFVSWMLDTRVWASWYIWCFALITPCLVSARYGWIIHELRKFMTWSGCIQRSETGRSPNVRQCCQLNKIVKGLPLNHTLTSYVDYLCHWISTHENQESSWHMTMDFAHITCNILFPWVFTFSCCVLGCAWYEGMSSHEQSDWSWAIEYHCCYHGIYCSDLRLLLSWIYLQSLKHTSWNVVNKHPRSSMSLMYDVTQTGNVDLLGSCDSVASCTFWFCNTSKCDPKAGRLHTTAKSFHQHHVLSRTHIDGLKASCSLCWLHFTITLCTIPMIEKRMWFEWRCTWWCRGFQCPD